MKLGVMQPYFFPYWGYWQLLCKVDKYVVYDDVNFIKGGWINRNYILANGERSLITLHLHGASSNKKIYEISIGNNKKKIMKTIIQNYSNCPEWSKVKDIIETIVLCETDSLSEYLFNQIKILCEVLSIKTDLVLSSKERIACQFSGQERIIELCKHYSADTYINAIGGKMLYSREIFKKSDIELNFVKPSFFIYKQKGTDNFIPGLSMVDLLCNVDITTLKAELANSELL